MEKDMLWEQIIGAMVDNMAPATGCTEPIALAYAAAVAAERLGEPVCRVEGLVSTNLMKNGMGVTVPGTGTPGLVIAAAVGALGGDASAGLQVLRHVTPDIVAAGQQLVADQKVTVRVKTNTPHILYAEARVYSAYHEARVFITDSHTNIVRIEVDGAVVFEKKEQADCGGDEGENFLHSLCIADLVDFAEHVDIEKIRFVGEAQRLNDRLSQEGLTGKYGLKIGYTLQQQVKKGLIADDLARQIQIRTVAASDARMGGAAYPAMTNSGSGNQGITASEPVTVVADYLQVDEETRLRALTLSNLMAIYAHSFLPKLSAFCATVTAAMGAAAGMAWLLDRQTPVQTISKAIASMTGDLVGMVCDGAANSCAMKVAASVSTAFRAVLLALADVRVAGSDGLVANSAEECIANVGLLATKGMQETDREVLSIMLQKNKK